MTSGKITSKKVEPRHVKTRIPATKDKENILKEAREKQHLTHSGKAIQNLSNISSEIKVRSKHYNLFQVLKGRDCQLQIVHPQKRSFENDRETQKLQSEEKPEEGFVYRPVLKNQPEVL